VTSPGFGSGMCVSPNTRPSPHSVWSNSARCPSLPYPADCSCHPRTKVDPDHRSGRMLVSKRLGEWSSPTQNPGVRFRIRWPIVESVGRHAVTGRGAPQLREGQRPFDVHKLARAHDGSCPALYQRDRASHFRARATELPPLVTPEDLIDPRLSD
jgi:hypothetical protein